MEIKIDVCMQRLGKGQIYNHCNERYDILGLICKSVGIKDSEMDYRRSLLLKGKKRGNLIEVRKLPEELSGFFKRDDSWDPVSSHLRGSHMYRVTKLGQEIINLNDELFKLASGSERLLACRNKLIDMLKDSGVNVTLVE